MTLEWQEATNEQLKEMNVSRAPPPFARGLPTRRLTWHLPTFADQPHLWHLVRGLQVRPPAPLDRSSRSLSPADPHFPAIYQGPRHDSVNGPCHLHASVERKGKRAKSLVIVAKGAGRSGSPVERRQQEMARRGGGLYTGGPLPCAGSRAMPPTAEAHRIDGRSQRKEAEPADEQMGSQRQAAGADGRPPLASLTGRPLSPLKSAEAQPRESAPAPLDRPAADTISSSSRLEP